MAEYHITLPVLWLNAEFLLCAQRLDSNFSNNMLVQDHLGKTPIYFGMTNLLDNRLESLGYATLLKPTDGTKRELDELMQALGQLSTMNTQTQWACKTPVDKPIKLQSTKELRLLFTNKTMGIVSLNDKQHIVLCIVYLLELIGHEMGKIDPLFECVPELKSSIQEYTKCGKLDELDTSMTLVNFRDYFDIDLDDNGESGLKFAKVVPQCSRYWISGKKDKVPSVDLCADFWKCFLKALETKTIQDYIKNVCLAIENCKRKHGFVGMLNVSCQASDRIQWISVDIAPAIVSDKLDGFIALLRPRHHDNKQIGKEYPQGLELSTSQKDWDFLKCLPSEVICGYTLVKIIRPLTGKSPSKTGKVFSAEHILPSYMLKTALLWILDPDNKFAKIYNKVAIDTVFDKEPSSSYKGSVLGLCQQLLQEPQPSWLGSEDVGMLSNICEKCARGTGTLTVRERTLPYVLAASYSGR